jgi:hypothetical protein
MSAMLAEAKHVDDDQDDYSREKERWSSKSFFNAHIPFHISSREILHHKLFNGSNSRYSENKFVYHPFLHSLGSSSKMQKAEKWKHRKAISSLSKNMPFPRVNGNTHRYIMLHFYPKLIRKITS